MNIKNRPKVTEVPKDEESLLRRLHILQKENDYLKLECESKHESNSENILMVTIWTNF